MRFECLIEWPENNCPLPLIHEADPHSRPVVIIVFAHIVRPSPLFKIYQNKTNFKRKQCSLLARLWVWPSGSLMTPVLSIIYVHAVSGSFVLRVYGRLLPPNNVRIFAGNRNQNFGSERKKISEKRIDSRFEQERSENQTKIGPERPKGPMKEKRMETHETKFSELISHILKKKRWAIIRSTSNSCYFHTATRSSKRAIEVQQKRL